MQAHELPRFHAVIIGLADYYGRQLSEGAISLYWAALKGYELAAVQKAAEAYITGAESSQFMPKAGDLIKLMDGGGAVDQAAIAWAKVEGAIRTVGPYQSVVFDDPIIHAALDAYGGWEKVCNVPSEDELPFVGKAFQTLYKGLRAQNMMAGVRYSPVLHGIAARENGVAGIQSQAPRLIGNREACLRVLENGKGPLLQVSAGPAPLRIAANDA
jgi:hypothetical protein